LETERRGFAYPSVFPAMFSGASKAALRAGLTSPNKKAVFRRLFALLCCSAPYKTADCIFTEMQSGRFA
jgi:hypothetical protein